MKLFFILILLSGSALAADLSCSALVNGKEIFRDQIDVTGETTELHLGAYREVELIGTAIQGQVSALMIFDGVMFGSISMNEASYTMFMIGEGELSLSCRLL